MRDLLSAVSIGTHGCPIFDTQERRYTFGMSEVLGQPSGKNENIPPRVEMDRLAQEAQEAVGRLRIAASELEPKNETLLDEASQAIDGIEKLLKARGLTLRDVDLHKHRTKSGWHFTSKQE